LPLNDSLPLLAHRNLDETVAWRGGRAVSAGEFVADVRALSAVLPRRRHLLNLCDDRYRFMVTLGAALVNGQITLLPPNRTGRLLGQIEAAYPDIVCVAEQTTALAIGDHFVYPDALPPRAGPSTVPRIPGRQTAAVIFTSGSTGHPTPHVKPWRKL